MEPTGRLDLAGLMVFSMTFNIAASSAGRHRIPGRPSFCFFPYLRR